MKMIKIAYLVALGNYRNPETNIRITVIQDKSHLSLKKTIKSSQRSVRTISLDNNFENSQNLYCIFPV